MDARLLKSLLKYDRKVGVFVWRVDVARNVKAGSIAGNVDSSGYVRIRIAGKAYAAHRLAWFYVYGVWPDDQLDHKNRDKTDNRIKNLRECTHTQNQQNRRPGKPYLTPQGKWMATIRHNKQFLYLGIFTKHADAQAAYLSAKEKLHFGR